ncbi:hypothetical protein [Synechococcus sp. CCY 9618]|uniref:hypothetical protein n=1 Tax=Synechococcus sp. CCY 9618 TaxID=2815602 RepID=UPI001C249B60|nr:hypothetical protein [Synechococcus sp. CCY 9618]
MFCTLFDSGYLPQGLALLRSLERHVPGMGLWVLAMDDRSHRLLAALQHPQLHLLRLEDCETDELRLARRQRSWGEYCWTLTPFLPELVLARDPDAEVVTYIDADCWLAGPVDSMLNRFQASGAHCMITPHAYSPHRDRTATAGTYCVQFMPFRRTPQALAMLHWWQRRCLEHCSGKLGPGPLGDQGHLEDWPVRFGADVFVLDRPALTLAPWNIERFWQEAATQPCLYHFQGFRLFRLGPLLVIRATAGVPVPRRAFPLLFTPYLRDILGMLQLLPRAVLAPRSLPSPWKDPRGFLLLLPRLLFLHWCVRLRPLPPAMRGTLRG